MKFFKEFEKIQYQNSILTDLTIRVNIINSVLETEGSTFEYVVKHKELPEDVAYNFYGDSGLHWLVLMANKMHHPFHDWYMTDVELLDYVNDKYETPLDVHHYLKDDVKYKVDPSGAVIKTNLEYEEDLNEDRRMIKVIYPDYISQIISELKDVVNG